MTPAETLAVYVALIGIPVFLGVLMFAVAHCAKSGDEQIEGERRASTSTLVALGAVGLSPEFRRDLEQSNERAEAMNEVWRRLSARG